MYFKNIKPILVIIFCFTAFSLGCHQKSGLQPVPSNSGESENNNNSAIVKDNLQPDSIEVHNGRNRIILFLSEPKDGKAYNYKVFWNNKKDSVAGPVLTDSKITKVVINNVAEGGHVFTVYQYDKEGNRSEGTKVSATTYGERYQASLIPRKLETIEEIEENSYLIHFSPGNALINVKYLNTEGDSTFYVVPANKEKDTITDMAEGTTFRYQSLFVPGVAGLDTFSTAYTSTDNKGIYLSPVLFDFSTSGGAHDGWNKVNTTSNNPFQIKDLVDYNGISTDVSFEMISRFQAQSKKGPDHDVFLWGDIEIPKAIINSSLYNNEANYEHAAFKISNLEQGVSYDFCFFASRVSTAKPRITRYIAEGKNKKARSLDISNNGGSDPLRTACIKHIQPDENGSIHISMRLDAGSDNTFYYIGVMKLSRSK